jgi:hypothetical protein
MTDLPARRRCRECSAEFWAIKHDQRFCRAKCRRAFWSWRKRRGAQAIELLTRWRRDRQPGSFTDLTTLAGELVREQREREVDGPAAGGGAAGAGKAKEGHPTIESDASAHQRASGASCMDAGGRR